jgi:hypothetical protein
VSLTALMVVAQLGLANQWTTMELDAAEAMDVEAPLRS